MSKNIKSFTLTEIIIVVVLIGILAAFSLPKYVKVFSRADERTGKANLMAMRTSMEFYILNQDTDPDPNWGNLNAINNALNLNISDVQMTSYGCWILDDGDANTCRAVHPQGWNLHFHDEHSGGLIHCQAGTACPSCPFEGGVGGNCE